MNNVVKKCLVPLLWIAFSCATFGRNDILSVDIEFTTEENGSSFLIRKSYNLLENQGRFISKTHKYATNHSQDANDLTVERIEDFGLSNARTLFDAVADFYGNRPELVEEVNGIWHSGRLNVGLFSEGTSITIMKEYPSATREEVEFWEFFESEVDRFQQSSKLLEETRGIRAILNDFEQNGILGFREIQNGSSTKFDRQHLFIKGVLDLDEWNNLWLASRLESNDEKGRSTQILVDHISLPVSNAILEDYYGKLVVLEGVLRWDEDGKRYTFTGRLEGEPGARK
ncbi:hypothetical protein [Pelagicoccus sp. SDUM812003]|uniref:hypothetical protein n=1 Tax=Pelagicoccus sp. SDUM812003 TaxID=3041267 RepID=UPI00280D9A00|nr:hypothetical protein [Pelagicoccus sp. SDUM812003]MDQ8203359.1 hypothetical protein [Pelagicoccus sp. SDUM812003]